MVRLRAVFLLGVTLGSLTGCGSSSGNGGGGTTPPPPSTGSLTITVSELPSTASANIKVSGPSGYSASVTSTQTLQVAPGSYTVAASSVSAGNSNYYPAIASQSATVAVSTTASVTVDYATIIPKTTKTLDAAGLSSLTVSSDGSTLTMSTSSAVALSLQPNDVLASGVAPAAPNGLLVRVQSISTSGGTVTASVTPAALTDAIQQGSVQITGVLSPDNTTTLSSSARPAVKLRRGRLRPDASQPRALTRGVCNGVAATIPVPVEISLPSPGNAGISFPAVSGEMDLCASYSFGIAIKDFHFLPGTDTVTLGFHTGLNALSEGKFSITKAFPITVTEPIPILIGGVPATVQVIVSPYGTVEIGEATGESVANNLSYDATLSLGVSYDGTTVSPLLSANSVPGASATVGVDGSIKATVKGGIQVGFKIDDSGTIYVKSDAYSTFVSDPTANPCWNLTWGVEGFAGAEIDLPLNIKAAVQTEPYKLLGPLPITQSNGTCFAPVLSTISPTTAVAGSGQVTLAVTGSNFVPDSTVNWNGQALATTYVDTTDLTAVVPASDLATGGTFPVTVNSPDSPGGTSAPINFTVSQVTVTVSPTIVAVPTGATQQFTATVSGTSNTAVNWSVNGIAGGNAAVGTISSEGAYAAPSAIPNPASVAITATSQVDLNASASATVSIIDGNYSYVSFNLPSSYSDITGVNDSGEIVGTYDTYSFSYSNGSTSTIQFPGSTATFADGINNAHQIVGRYQMAGTGDEGFGFINSNGTYTSFPLPSPANYGYVRGISDSGTVVGDYSDPDTGFYLTNGSLTTIQFPGSSGTIINGVTEDGTIYGTYGYMPATGFTYYNGNYGSITLPAPANSGNITALNDSGDVVGTSPVGAINSGFVYTGGTVKVIQYPGSLTTYPERINNAGQIVGTYTMGGGQYFGFIATPIK